MAVTSPHDRPFRFSVQCSSLPGTSRSWADLACTCEDLGYSTLTIADHLDDQLAPVPALMAAADATTSLRVGALVFCNDYKHPVVLAKEAATLDLLSGGRLELGIGAGWMTSDYERAGIALDPAGVRIERLAEAVAVIKGLLADDPCTFSGRHYEVTGLDGRPKPVQRPHPPILIGGGGRKVLALAGREADVVGLNVNLAKGVIDASAGPNGTAAATDEKLQWVRAAAGPRWADLEIQVRVHLAVVTDDRDGVVDALAGGFGLTPAQARETPHALCGSVEQIADDLVERRDRFGISAIGVSVDVLHDLAPVVARLAGT
jgi:probable F420-dependent oxidoreductase